MNEYSFIIMRIKDINKLERVKQETLKIVVKKGYHGATISQIAKKAKVSDGYLYRHYANKSELVQTLFIENMNLYHSLILNLTETEKYLRFALSLDV